MRDDLTLRVIAVSRAARSAASRPMVRSGRTFRARSSLIPHPSSLLVERGHDFLREQLHGLQHALLVEVAEAEVAIEIRDAHGLVDALDLANARLRRADDEVVLDEL